MSSSMNYYKASMYVTTTQVKVRICDTSEAPVMPLPNIYLLPSPHQR